MESHSSRGSLVQNYKQRSQKSSFYDLKTHGTNNKQRMVEPNPKTSSNYNEYMIKKGNSMQFVDRYSTDQIIQLMTEIILSRTPDKICIEYAKKVKKSFENISKSVDSYISDTMLMIQLSINDLMKFKYNRPSKKALEQLNKLVDTPIQMKFTGSQKIKVRELQQVAYQVSQDTIKNIDDFMSQIKKLSPMKINMDYKYNGIKSIDYERGELKKLMSQKVLKFLSDLDQMFFEAISFFENVFQVFKPFYDLSQQIMRNVPVGVASRLKIQKMRLDMSEQQINNYLKVPACQSFFEPQSVDSMVISVNDPTENPSGLNIEFSIYNFFHIFTKAMDSISRESDHVFESGIIDQDFIDLRFKYPENKEYLSVDPEYLYKSAIYFQEQYESNFEKSRQHFQRQMQSSNFESWNDVSIFENCSVHKMIEFVSAFYDINLVLEDMIIATKDILKLNTMLNKCDALIKEKLQI